VADVRIVSEKGRGCVWKTVAAGSDADEKRRNAEMLAGERLTLRPQLPKPFR